MNKTINCFVSGKVQGVSYRVAACQQAKMLGLTGWVRNLRDGRVEVTVTGKIALIDEFHQWLANGSSMAEVVNVECRNLETLDFEDFTIC